MLGGYGDGCAWSHDDINLECNQFSRKSGKPLELPFGISVFNHNVAALDVTEVTQSLEEGHSQVGVGARVERQKADSRGPGRCRLRLDGEGHGEEAAGESADQRPSIQWISDQAAYKEIGPANRGQLYQRA